MKLDHDRPQTTAERPDWEYTSSPAPNLLLAHNRLPLRERVLASSQRAISARNSASASLLKGWLSGWLNEYSSVYLGPGIGRVCSISDTSLSSSFLSREHSRILTHDSN